MSKRSGPSKTHAERIAAGRVLLYCYLSPEAGARLAELVERYGSRTAAIEALLLSTADPAPPK